MSNPGQFRHHRAQPWRIRPERIHCITNISNSRVDDLSARLLSHMWRRLMMHVSYLQTLFKQNHGDHYIQIKCISTHCFYNMCIYIYVKVFCFQSITCCEHRQFCSWGSPRLYCHASLYALREGPGMSTRGKWWWDVKTHWGSNPLGFKKGIYVYIYICMCYIFIHRLSQLAMQSGRSLFWRQFASYCAHTLIDPSRVKAAIWAA